jgi:hypothetical protein
MSLRNWGGFWAALVFAILPTIDPAFAQDTTAPGAAISAAPATSTAPVPPSVQAPVITNQSANVPDAAGSVQTGPAGEPAAVEGASKAVAAPPADRNEFQEFVARSVGYGLPLFGYDLFRDAPSTFAPLDKIAVPADYVIGPGDEIYVRAWGQIDIRFPRHCRS